MNQELLQVLDSIYKMEPPRMFYLCHVVKQMPCNFMCSLCPLSSWKEGFRYKYIPQLISIKEVK